MFKKCCLKSVPGPTNMPKNTKQVKPPVTFITSAWGWSETVFNIKPIWSIGF